MNDTQRVIWTAFRQIQERFINEAIRNPHFVGDGETLTDYANRKINEMSHVELIDALTD